MPKWISFHFESELRRARFCVNVYMKFDKETDVSVLSAQTPVTTFLTGSIYVSLIYTYSTNILINCVYLVIYCL